MLCTQWADNWVTGGSSAQDKLCTPWADNCVTRASSVQDKWCTQWADMRNPLKKKRSGSEQKSDLATTRCGSNGRSQITGAHSSQSLKPRSHSPSQFLTKSLFALLQIALIRKHVPDPAPQFTTKSLLALYKITLCTFADRSDPQTRP